MTDNIYIIGHKNPDTDSICAAISYARFKHLQGETRAVPARAGSVNPQTEFVLNHHGVPAPRFLPNVIPTVGQAMTADVVSRPRDTALRDILELMDERNIRLIPLVDDNNHYCGMVSLFDVAHEFYLGASPQSCREIFTSINHLHQVLGGELLYASAPEAVFEGVFLVGAMKESSFKEVLLASDPQKCLVITGDRTGIQQAAIRNGVKALIVTGGLPVDNEICRLAQENKVSLLSSPYDSATTVRMVRLSTPAYRVAQKKSGFLAADEHLNDVRLKILSARDRGMVVLDEDEKLIGVITRADLLRFEKIKLILVDHNEISQSVDGADLAEIVEIIDHHRLGNSQTLQPILFINQPVGSTCTLIAKLYFEQQVDLDTKTAGLLLSGIISDTLNLKSPTATELDERMIEKLNKIAGLDLPAYCNQLFAAGASLCGRSPEEIILNDFKEYNAGKVTIGLGQVEVVGLNEFEKVKARFIDKIKQIRAARGYQFTALMVTDISTSNSLLVFDGLAKLCACVSYPVIETNIAELKGVLSRKKQLLPHLLSVFKDVGPA